MNGSHTSDKQLWAPHLSDARTVRENRLDADSIEIPSPTSLSTNSSFEALPDTEQMHLRTTSYASTLRKHLPKFMVGKKSLPDLRTAHKIPTKSAFNPSEGRTPLTPHDEEEIAEESLNLSLFRKDSDFSSSSPSAHPEYKLNTLPSLATDCASYFRRSSTLPIHNSLPKSLFCLLESARSILFAMSKLYQTLEHYVHLGFDEQLSSISKKSLDTANFNISLLIRSLERFDDFSPKAEQSPAVCRALVESCRDAVIMMKKAVGLLTLQIGLEPFNRRYSRWLILELYAITAEIALAWQATVPYIDSLRSFLYGNVSSYANNLESLASPIYNSDQRLMPGVRLRPAETLYGGSVPIGTGRVRIPTRRQAGSFSSKDLQIGKELPSYDVLPTTMPGLVTHTSTLRTPKRQATMPLFSASSSTLPSCTSRSSLIEPLSLAPSLSESLSDIAAVDKKPLHAVRDALEAAPVIWDQIEEALGDISNRDTQQFLEKARFITRKFSDNVHAVSEKSPESDKKAISDSAQLFWKVREPA